MCSGPGSAGRQRDRRCAADILLILPLLFFPLLLFSLFLFCFGFLSRSAVLLKSHSPQHISHILLAPPCPAHFWPGVWSNFLICAFIPCVCSFKFGVVFCPVETARARLRKWQNKDGEMFLKRSKLLDSCAFALARPFQQIPSRPFFCIGLTFSQLRTLLFPSRSFFPHQPFSTPFSFPLSGAFFFFFHLLLRPPFSPRSSLPTSLTSPL